MAALSLLVVAGFAALLIAVSIRVFTRKAVNCRRFPSTGRGRPMFRHAGK
jgi:hypothetical protein